MMLCITFEAWFARAREVVDVVVTNSSIQTRIACAVIDVDLTVLAIKADGALAVIVVDQILAFSPLLARILLALIDVHVAVLALEPGKAVAFEVIDQVHASWRRRWFSFRSLNMALCHVMTCSFVV